MVIAWRSYELKYPYRDGSTHVLFEPLGFTDRLAALVLRAHGCAGAVTSSS